MFLIDSCLVTNYLPMFLCFVLIIWSYHYIVLKGKHKEKIRKKEGEKERKKEMKERGEIKQANKLRQAMFSGRTCAWCVEAPSPMSSTIYRRKSCLSSWYEFHMKRRAKPKVYGWMLTNYHVG